MSRPAPGSSSPAASALACALFAASLAGCAAQEGGTRCDSDACGAPDACASTEWSCSDAALFTPASMGGHIHLADAPDGSLAVTFFDADSAAIVLGRGAPGEPVRTIQLDDGTDSGAPTGPNAVAVDADAGVHVVYVGSSGASLNYARVEGLTVVERSIIESSGGPYLHPSLAVSGNAVHVVYYDSRQAAPRHAERTDTGWDTETIPAHDCPDPCDAPPDRGRFSSLGLIAGQPVIAYYDRTNGDLVLARRQGSKWLQSVLDGTDPTTGQDTGDVGRWPSLHVDPSGTVAVAYQDSTRGALRYASSPGGELQIEVVDDGTREDPVHKARWDGVVGAFVSLLTGPDGAPVVYYLDSTDASVRRSVRASAGWSKPEVVSSSPGGLWVSAVRTSLGVDVVCSEGWDASADGKGIERRLRWWRP